MKTVGQHFTVSIVAILFCFTLTNLVQAETQLDSVMKKMSGAYKQLAFALKTPSDANKDQYLALVTTLKEQSKIARDLVPQKAANLPADQQAAMVAGYQKSMDALSPTFDALAQDLQAGNWDDANKIMAEIKQQMSEGHHDFKAKH